MGAHLTFAPDPAIAKIVLDKWRNKSEYCGPPCAGLAAHRAVSTAGGTEYNGNFSASDGRTKSPRASARRRLLRGLASLLGLRILPPRPGEHRQEHRRRT